MPPLHCSLPTFWSWKKWS